MKRKRSELADLMMLNLLAVIIFGILKREELFYIAIINAGLCTSLRAFLNDKKNGN